MQTTYRLDASELNEKFVESIRALFAGKRIAVSVSDEVAETEMDETEYLMKEPANREHLLRSIRDLDEGKGVRMSMDELEQRVK